MYSFSAQELDVLQRAFHALYPVLSISFASPKRNGRKKRAPLRGANRDRTIAHFFEMTAIVCAYNVFGFAECLGVVGII